MGLGTSFGARSGTGWNASLAIAGKVLFAASCLCSGLSVLSVLSCTTQIDNAAQLPPAGISADAGGQSPASATGAVSCPGGGTTTISGTVVAPTPARFGRADPLYNALVYVPTTEVAAFSAGVSCDRCGSVSGAPRTTVLTGPDGRFTLPVGAAGRNVPLVIQIGRWRRQVVVPEVVACADTPLPLELTRLPRNRSEGDIPAIAIATGQWDPFDCTLRKIGIDESEFTLPGGAGRVNMWTYKGHHLGPGTPYGDQLIGSAPTMNQYDIVILPCDSADSKSPLLQRNLVDYANKGGRIFLTDWSYSWLRDGQRGTFENTVIWKSDLPAQQGIDFVGRVDLGFPKGVSFSQWLSVVGATGATSGQIPIHDPLAGFSIIEKVVPPTQSWIYTDGTTAGAVPSIQNFTFNTPVGIADDQQCGRVVFSQFHVASDSVGDGLFTTTATPPGRLASATFPSQCNARPMTPQEKALEFMLFDASSCIEADRTNPIIP
ncbi:MAG TPA: hypothetical protein VNO55_23370 [Polyangia bacterium]|nr:hypothetical protein [Polyangia bacterium]